MSDRGIAFTSQSHRKHQVFYYIMLCRKRTLCLTVVVSIPPQTSGLLLLCRQSEGWAGRCISSQSHRKHQVFYYICVDTPRSPPNVCCLNPTANIRSFTTRDSEGQQGFPSEKRSQSHRKHQVFYYDTVELVMAFEEEFESQSHRKHQVFYYTAIALFVLSG